MLFIDIDQFKSLNDEQGHHTGDEALKALSVILTNNSRAGDVVSRFGGDEFALLFPETDATSCSMLANRCLLYTSDAADERSSVDLGGRRIFKKKNMNKA